MSRRSAPHLALLHPAPITNLAAGHVSIRFGRNGPNLRVIRAYRVRRARPRRRLRDDPARRRDVIAGGAEAPICVVGVGGFTAMRALSTRNDDAEQGSRPSTGTATGS